MRPTRSYPSDGEDANEDAEEHIVVEEKEARPLNKGKAKAQAYVKAEAKEADDDDIVFLEPARQAAPPPAPPASRTTRRHRTPPPYPRPRLARRQSHPPPRPCRTRHPEAIRRLVLPLDGLSPRRKGSTDRAPGHDLQVLRPPLVLGLW